MVMQYNMNEAITELIKVCKDYDWFYDVDSKQDKLIVYVTKMGMDVFKAVPDTINNKQVLIHYAGSKTAQLSDFVNSNIPIPLTKSLPEIEELSEEYVVMEQEEDFQVLVEELLRLEKICGKNVLQSLFFEIHDGDDAITNLSDKFPVAYISMKKLYDKYGYDVLYDAIQ